MMLNRKERIESSYCIDGNILGISKILKDPSNRCHKIKGKKTESVIVFKPS